jgi:parvulin-like peptidyl-prolyl isomerase
VKRSLARFVLVSVATMAVALLSPFQLQAQYAYVSDSVPRDAPAITLSGLCNNGFDSNTTAGHSLPGGAPPDGVSAPSAATRPDCKVVVTREQLEKLSSAIGARSSTGLALAYQYADMLRFAAKGHELGIENDPRFLEKVRYSYLREMAQFAVVVMQERADDFQDAELENYYNEHPGDFVQMQLSQLAVPKQKTHKDGSTSKTASQVGIAAEMKKLAVRMQKEAAAGGNFDTLEERIYRIVGDEAVPGTELGVRTPDTVPPEYRKLIFDLQPGQVSQVFEDSHEYLILKCVHRRIMPLAESRHFYGQLRMKAMRKALEDGVKTQFNDEYFVKPPAEEASGRLPAELP